MTPHTILIRSLAILVGGLIGIWRAPDRKTRPPCLLIGACIGCMIGDIADLLVFG